MNDLRSGTHVLRIGAPGSGKSTLLMQAASELSEGGHKLVYENVLTTDKAGHIVRRLRGEHATIFIDDFSRSIGAVERLAAEPNVKLACFERDYNFDIVSHRVRGARFAAPVDVTELTVSDVQDLWNWIPEPSRQDVVPDQTRPGVKGMTATRSLFEIVEHCVKGARLRERFRGVLSQLAGRPEQALLIMFAYVHSCRTPVSYDMASAFLSERVTGYGEVTRTIQSLGQLVAEYDGLLADSQQDHFVQRSSLVAEAVIECSQREEFRSVFETFHQEVSPLRICSYDVFRRHAFDWKFAKKAYSNWQEGLDFYDRMLHIERNPYFMQHAALFLSDHGRMRDAFARIDEALRVSGGRRSSIRNSHAVILFRANSAPEVREQPGARAELHRALQILEECRAQDDRKAYHVVAYANFSLDYARFFGADVAGTYLGKAKQWLVEEQRRSPWHRALARILREVKSMLGERS